MSVLVTLRMRGNGEKLEAYAAEKPDLLASVIARAKSFGVISHHFYATEDEILVVDEWPDEQSFRSFFEAIPEIAGLMENADARSEPTVTFWRPLETNDQV